MADKGHDVVIELVRVKKIYYGKETKYEAIRGISIQVKKGEFVSVLGPSGSGKTTLLDLAGTLDSPTEGHVFIDGIDVSKMNGNELSEIRNRKIGFIFQSYNLVPYLGVLENATLPLMVENRDTPENINRAKALLTEVGLGDKLNKKPTELSGGEQQRVAIVRAFVNSPQVLLADEPTGNLDSKSADIVMNMIIKMSKEFKVTILMVTHSPEVASFSQRSIYLKDGLVEKEVKVRK